MKGLSDIRKKRWTKKRSDGRKDTLRNGQTDWTLDGRMEGGKNG